METVRISDDQNLNVLRKNNIHNLQRSFHKTYYKALLIAFISAFIYTNVYFFVICYGLKRAWFGASVLYQHFSIEDIKK